MIFKVHNNQQQSAVMLDIGLCLSCHSGYRNSHNQQHPVVNAERIAQPGDFS